MSNYTTYPKNTIASNHRAFMKRDLDIRISSKTYKNVIDGITEAFADEVIYNSYNWRLPYCNGNLHVRQFKPRFLDDEGNLLTNKIPADYKATNKKWLEDSGCDTLSEMKASTTKEWRAARIVRQFNRATNNLVCSLYFSKISLRNRNKSYYIFKPCKSFSRKLSEHFADPDRSNHYIDTTDGN